MRIEILNELKNVYLFTTIIRFVCVFVNDFYIGTLKKLNKNFVVAFLIQMVHREDHFSFSCLH